MAGIPEDHDLISIPEITEQGIISEIASLYESGHSIPEISKTTGVSRTSVRSHLIRGGVSLRPSTHAPAKGNERHSGQVRWNSPYGFQYLKGQLVPHPQEFETLRLILSQYRKTSSYEEIAKQLNGQKLRPRSAKLWTRFTVRQIVKWHQANPKVLETRGSPSARKVHRRKNVDE
jgi:DNA-binding CsgD family transcriptional regulator